MPLCKPESSLGGSWWEEKQRDDNFILQKHKTGIWAYRYRIILAANHYVVAKAKSEDEIGRDWALLQTTSDKMKVHGTLSKDGVISFFVRFWQQYRNDAARGLVPSSSVLRQDTEAESLPDPLTDDGVKDGRTVLHMAASRGDLAGISQLLHDLKEGRLDVDINQIDTHGWTALHCACEAGHLEVCDMLLLHGANPSVPTNDGNLALHYIASQPSLSQSQITPADDEQGDNGDDDEGSNGNYLKKEEDNGRDDPLYIKVLLKMLTGVDVNTRNYQGETALHKAVLRGSRAAVDMLIKCSHANVNACNQYGETPLFYAIRRNALEIVRILLWYGADKDFVGPAGTPTEVAMQMGYDHIVSVLEEAPNIPVPAVHKDPSSDPSESDEIIVADDTSCDNLAVPILTSLDEINLFESTSKRERRGWGAWRELARKAVGSTGLGSLRREKARGVWKVYITSYTGKYLTAKSDGKICLSRRLANESTIVPTSSPLDGAEGQMWLLQRVSKGDDGGENQYALRSCYGKYLRAAPDGNIRVEREIVGESETWTGTDQRLRVLALRSRYSKFLCAHPGGRVRADSDKAEEWEEWSIHDADGERGVMRDLYGFVVPRQEVELYERFVARYYNKRVPQQRRDWRKYLASNDLEKEIQNDSSQLKKLIRTVGIPPEKRRKLWYKLSGAEGKASVSARAYYDLLKQVQQNNVEVERDVARTFPTHSYFREEEARAALTRVLSAYAVWNPSLGYCQSMNFIAGLLLLVTDEESAFWLLSKIVEDMLVDYFTPSMLGLLVDQQVLAALVRARMPAVYSHLSMLGVPVHSFTTKWLMCMFADSAPTETVLRIWDFIFTDGSHILFHLVYALFKTHQTTILRLSTAQEIVNLFKQTLRETYEPDSWFKVAFESQRDALLTPNNLSSMRQTYLASILQEQKLHSKKKDIFILQQNTSFSADELECMHNEYDTLTAASLRNRLELYDFPFVLQSLSPNWSKVSYSRTRALFELFDKDGDGILSFHELALGLSPLLKGPLDPLLQMFFRLFGQKAPQLELTEGETGEESAADDETMSGDRGGSGTSSITGSADQADTEMLRSGSSTALNEEREAKESEDVATIDRSSIARLRDGISVVFSVPGEMSDQSEDLMVEPKEKDKHGDIDEIDSEYEEDRQKRKEGGIGGLIVIGNKRIARSISASESSLSSTNSYSDLASSYERRREERERLAEGADLVVSGDDMAELIATLRLVYGPVLVGFSVGSGESLITNELFLRQEKDRIQQKLRSALGVEEATPQQQQPKLFTWQQFKETMYDHHADLIFLITEYLSESSSRRLRFSS